MVCLEQMYITLLYLVDNHYLQRYIELILLLTTSVISKCGTFSPFLSLVTLFSVLPCNFIVSSVKSSRYLILILNVILFSILLTYILTEELSIFPSCFFKIYRYLFRISDTEYNPSGNSNFLFHVGADILNLLLLYELFIFFNV